MKKIIASLLLSVPMMYSCTRNSDYAPDPQIMVTVEATSGSPSSIDVPSSVSASFAGSYKNTFPAKQNNIAVYMHSDVASMKSIVIYVNGNEVARRSGNCTSRDYSLTYDLHNY